LCILLEFGRKSKPTEKLMKIELGKNTKGVVEMDTGFLNHHVAVFGSTGSGKTGQVISMIEQAMQQGVPVFMVDVKGDLINALQQEESILQKLDVRILTPGATHGTSVNLFLGLNDPNTGMATLGELCELIGISRNPMRSKGFAFLAAVVQDLHKRKKPCSLRILMEQCQEPQIKKVGVLPVEEAISPKMRKDLLLRLNGLFCDPDMADWMQGIDLDIPCLLDSNPDKTPVIVYSVVHLVNDDERLFALTLFFEKMVAWMREKGGKEKMRGVLVVDECYGMMPPHPQNPPTKPLLMTMFKQGRDYGLGVICATQNPKDVCYKVLGNCHTWIVGKLQTDNDRGRVLEGVVSASGGDRRVLGKVMAGLGKREFVRIHNGEASKYYSRQCQALLTGPCSIPEVETIHAWFDPKSFAKRMWEKALSVFNKDKSDQSLLSLLHAENNYRKAGGSP